MATKTSILIFYLRLSKNTQKFLRRASYGTLALVNIEGVVMTFLNVFQCNPVAAAYMHDIPATCVSVVTLYLCSAPVNIVANLAILILPIPLLTGMHLPQRQKTVLVLTFSLGIFVTIVDVVRIYYLQKASDIQNNVDAKMRLGSSTDFAWNASVSLMWSAVEVNTGIICACIPTLKPLIRRILPSMIPEPVRLGSSETASADSQRRASTGVPNSSSGLCPPAPLATARLNGYPSGDMNMMDFLTTPETTRATLEAEIAQSQSRRTLNTTRTNGTANTVYFGLIDMKRPDSMLKTSGMECFKYCTAVTVLFFLWGFSYGLLNALNNQVSTVTRETQAQRLGLSSSYFLGYFFGPLTLGQWILRNWGFKATFITGLCIYGTGTLMFWPSAVLKSWPGFLICQFVVGYGLAMLETAANPFVALCGPSQYAEHRLLLAQGVQAVGSVLSQLFGQKVLFNEVQPDSLLDVQWTYLAVALVSVFLALFFYYMPLPEATDSDLQSLAENLSIYPSQIIAYTKLPLIYTTATLAIICQFLYVAAQEGNSAWSGTLLESLSSLASLKLNDKDFNLVSGALFAISRVTFAFLCLIIHPRILLLICFLFATLFATLTYTLSPSGNAIAGPHLALYFFEGPIFPLVFAIGLRGMGRWTKWVASMLVCGVSGGAVVPFVMWAIKNSTSVQKSYCVPVALFAIGTLFPLYLTLVRGARHQVDPAVASTLGDLSMVDGQNARRGSILGGLWGKKRGSCAGPVVQQLERRKSEGTH